jgi:hypothetical protein
MTQRNYLLLWLGLILPTLVGCGERSFARRPTAVSSLPPSDNSSDAQSSNTITETEAKTYEDMFKKADDAGELPPAQAVETPPAGGATLSTEVMTNFNKWCKNAAETKMLMSSSGLRALLSDFCVGGAATELLSSRLIARAYQGSGTISFHTIRALSSNSATDITSMRVAFAMKLPFAAKDYFDRVLPGVLQPAGLKAMVEGPGGVATIRVLSNLALDGTHHIRGVTVNQELRKTVSGRAVTVESDSRYDHFLFDDGAMYMLTGTVLEAVSSIQRSDTISALIKVNGSSYLISVIDIAVPNRNFPRIAEPELSRSVAAGTLALWNRIVASVPPAP